MPPRRLAFATSLLVLLSPCVAAAQPSPGNRLAYLDESDPYYVSRHFPKLTTPQWVGEEGVEAVVVLAIDDMREPQKYEAFLRPILRRLQQIDGRAPVSIMTNRIDPQDPHLQKWLKEGLSLDVHTYDHPCPFFKGGDFAKAKETYDRCVDLLAEVAGNRPVAFRMPCCDSLNTPSPRFYAEIFNQRTAKGNFLTIDSSVFMLYTADDPELPRELVVDGQGRERFRKYLPTDRTFVNTVENYPYPYVIGRLCWQFPCMVPSDWEAQHLQKPKNPQTVADWKAALDATVVKQGVFTMVFHPHGWISNDQIVELIDHAVAKHGKKVKFLTFREAEERLNRHLLAGQPLRHPKNGMDNGVRLLDVNDDGYLDVLLANQDAQQTRVWQPERRVWESVASPVRLTTTSPPGDFGASFQARFGFLGSTKYPSVVSGREVWHFDGRQWGKDARFDKGLPPERARRVPGGVADDNFRLLDLDGDGRSEILWQPGALAWSEQQREWSPLSFQLPAAARVASYTGAEVGTRLIDIDEDGRLDVIVSNENEYGIYLFKDMESGWSRKVVAGKRTDPDALPMIANKGTNNGFWVHSGQFWWSNESTPLLKDHVDRRAISDFLKDVEPGPRSAEAALRSLKPRPGFTVELMAAEPLVQDPVAFAWGPDGKFWVVEMGDYPLGTDGKNQHGGNVKFLEDADGDGRYDKATLFLEKIGFPTGVLPWGKGVLVTCAPDVFYAEDGDGDGKADVRRVLYTGFREGNQQHRVNGPVWGLDNWVYLANGDSGGTVKSVQTGLEVDIRGRDLRIRPDSGAIQAQAGQTQFGRNRDDWGHWFGNNNSNPMFHFPLPDHYLRRNPHFAPPDPKVQVSVTPGSSPVYPLSRALPRFNNPQSVNRFTSACSAMIYRDDLFGPAFAGNSFVSEPVHNLVHREIVRPKGVNFTSDRADDERQSEFLASTDNWFRPTMLQTGPDGALWVADMYRHVIEHPEWIPKDWQAKLDLRAGHDKGRIYRVYPTGTKPRAIPRLDKLDTAGLVAALDTPNGWQRDTAQMLLVRSGEKSAAPLLAKLATASQRPLARLHALCTLDGLNALDAKVLHRALADAHPGVRRHAVRLCEGRTSGAPELLDGLLQLTNDADPQVQLQLAFTLGEVADARAAAALGRLALRHAGDRSLLAAVLSSVTPRNIDRVLLAVLQEGQNAPTQTAVFESLMGLAQRQGNPAVVRTLLTRLATSENGSYTDAQFAAVAALLDALDQKNTSLAGLAKQEQEWRPVVEKLGGLFTAARQTAGDDRSAPERRRTALRLLGRGPDRQAEDVQALAALVQPRVPQELQVAAVQALGRLRSKDVPALLLHNWKSYSPTLRGETLDALLARPEGVAAVLDGLDKGRVLPAEIDVARQQTLLQHRTAAVRDRAAKLLAGTVNPDRGKVVAAYRSALTEPGDAAKGRELFAKHCATCHKLGDLGQEVGPDLTALGGKTRDALLLAVLDPNQAVEARYVNYTAITANGLTISGLLASETGTSLTLAGPDGKKHQLLRADIEELFSSGKSVMPEGLEKEIKPAQMADLLAFVQAQVPAARRKTFAGNTPEVARPADDGTLTLTAVGAEIYGPSLVLEQRYGNLGYWSSAQDHAAWSAEVPRAGAYEVWLDYACHDASAGNTLALESGPHRLVARVAGTGDWDTYRRLRVGTVTLDAGRQRLTVRPLGPVNGALLDLRSVRLVPVASGVLFEDGEVLIVTLGDSITKGVRPGVKAEETFAALLEKGLRAEKVNATVVNVGIGGERTDQALLRLDRDVLARKPQLVTVMYGTNDSYVDPGKTDSRLSPEQYRANLRTLVAKLRAAGVQPVLMTEPRWGDRGKLNGLKEHPNVRLERYVEICREVAREAKTPLADHYAHWSAARDRGTDIGAWTTDQCHPNPAGHRAIAATLLPVVLAAVRAAQ